MNDDRPAANGRKRNAVVYQWVALPSVPAAAGAAPGRRGTCGSTRPRSRPLRRRWASPRAVRQEVRAPGGRAQEPGRVPQRRLRVLRQPQPALHGVRKPPARSAAPGPFGSRTSARPQHWAEMAGHCPGANCGRIVRAPQDPRAVGGHAGVGHAGRLPGAATLPKTLTLRFA